MRRAIRSCASTAEGNLYVAGIAFNRNFDQPDRPVDNLVYVARYDYTPGTPGGTSTPNSAANPPNFTYAGTTVVDRGAVGFAVPGVVGFAGTFTDKEWMEIDTNAPADSPCAGNVYVAYTNFHGVSGQLADHVQLVVRRRGDLLGPKTISTGGRSGTPANQGADIAVGPDGTIYVAYSAFEPGTGVSSINLVKSTDCGKDWSQPVVVGCVNDPQAPGVAFRTPAFAFVAADDTDPDIVYVAYQSFVGRLRHLRPALDRRRSHLGSPGAGERRSRRSSPDLPDDRRLERRAARRLVRLPQQRDAGERGARRVLRMRRTAAGDTYPTFSHNVRVTDVSHNGNCLMFGGGTAAFHGDYNELDARTGTARTTSSTSRGPTTAT